MDGGTLRKKLKAVLLTFYSFWDLIMRDIITRVYVYTYLLLLMVFYFSDAHAGGFETKGMGSRQLSMGGD